MFEGHDTTANSMAFATYLLARYPKVQARARAELNEIFGGDAGRHVAIYIGWPNSFTTDVANYYYI